jgi:hypothetical protein
LLLDEEIDGSDSDGSDSSAKPVDDMLTKTDNKINLIKTFFIFIKRIRENFYLKTKKQQ